MGPSNRLLRTGILVGMAVMVLMWCSLTLSFYDALRGDSLARQLWVALTWGSNSFIVTFGLKLGWGMIRVRR